MSECAQKQCIDLYLHNKHLLLRIDKQINLESFAD